MDNRTTLFCDGASRGNPGPAAYGFVIYQNNAVVFEEGKRLGSTTNNVAEYQALIHGLKAAIKHGAQNLTVKSDSELMVRQLNGIYKVRTPHIIPLFQEAKELLSNFSSVEVLHVRREENKRADALCNQALDEI